MKKICVIGVAFIVFLLIQPVIVKADIIPEGYYRIRNVNSNLYLDAEGLADKSNIRQMFFPEWIIPQKFLILHQYEDYYSIHAYDAQNLVVDVANASNAAGANIWLYNTNFSDAQQWKFLNNGDGSFRVMSKCSDGTKAMVVQYASTESGGNVIQYSFNNTLNEKWFLEAAIEEGVYRIKNKKTGLYMTVNRSRVQQTTLDGGNVNQRFKITPSSNGYFDIAPDSDHNKSLGVGGWDVGTDNEWASIYCDYGQSADGQRWRFLVNEDGSFRIVSELSDCQKAMTADGDNIFSVTYNKDNNSGWELEPVPSSDEYCKEGKHVVLSFDTEKYLEKYAGTDEKAKIKIKDWISNLDKAYENYAELMGAAPQNGEKIWIVPSNYTGPNGTYALYTYKNTRLIFVPFGSIRTLLERAVQGDWSFGILHEMGHTFDVDSRWGFHDEFFANFKMAYVLKKNDGKFKIITNKDANGNERDLTKYSDIIKEYREVSENAYTKTIGANPRRTHIDGLNYMFLQQLEDYGDWEWVKGAFRNIRNTPVSVSNPTTQIEKYNYFLNEINNQSNGVFMQNWLASYRSENAYVASEFANGTFTP